LPFDTAFAGFNGGDVTGWELYGRVPLFREWLVAEGSFSRWVSGLRWAYLPAETGRGAIEAHSLPLPSGNLEILARIEARRNGSMQVPIIDEDGEADLVPSVPRTIFDAYLQIRILDLRMFIRFDDMTGQNEEYIPGQSVRGPRILYGVKWRFFN
jgi:hypothetical protein